MVEKVAEGLAEWRKRRDATRRLERRLLESMCPLLLFKNKVVRSLGHDS